MKPIALGAPPCSGPSKFALLCDNDQEQELLGLSRAVGGRVLWLTPRVVTGPAAPQAPMPALQEPTRGQVGTAEAVGAGASQRGAPDAGDAAVSAPAGAPTEGPGVLQGEAAAGVTAHEDVHRILQVTGLALQFYMVTSLMPCRHDCGLLNSTTSLGPNTGVRWRPLLPATGPPAIRGVQKCPAPRGWHTRGRCVVGLTTRAGSDMQTCARGHLPSQHEPAASSRFYSDRVAPRVESLVIQTA